MARLYDIRPKYRNKKRITYQKPYRELAKSTRRGYRARVDPRPPQEKRKQPIDTLPLVRRAEVIYQYEQRNVPQYVPGEPAPVGTGEKRTKFGDWLSAEELEARNPQGDFAIKIYDTFFGPVEMFYPQGQMMVTGDVYRTYNVGLADTVKEALNYPDPEELGYDPDWEFIERRFIILSSEG